MSIYALDSNIVSFYLRGNHGVEITILFTTIYSVVITPNNTTEFRCQAHLHNSIFLNFGCQAPCVTPLPFCRLTFQFFNTVLGGKNFHLGNGCFV